MNDAQSSPDLESLERPLAAAVQAAMADRLPENAIERVKVRARHLAATNVSPSRTSGSHVQGWRTSRSLVATLTVAAALLAVVIGVSSLLDRSAGQAFAQVIEKVSTAASVRFTTNTQFGQQPKTAGRMYLEGNRMRLEQSQGMLIQVADFDRKRALLLDMHRKVAQQLEIDANVTQKFANPVDQLRQAKPNDAERIGEEIVKGRRMPVYRLRTVDLLGMKGDAEMLVWVDGESGLPAKIVIRNSDPKAETQICFDDFVWNEPLDAQLFSLSVPAGFQSGVVATAPRPSEAAKTDAAAPDSAPALADGVLRDRVPMQIIWNRHGTTITVLMKDPESVPLPEHKPNELRQWDVATGRLRWSERVAGAGWVAGTTDGKTLATVIGREIQLRDAATGKVTRKWTTDEHLSPLAFSPDGRILAAGICEWGPHGGRGGAVSGGVQFWDIERAQLVRSIADDKPVTFLKFSVDGAHLATSWNEGPVKLWDTATGELTRIFPGRAGADFSPDGQTLACQSAASFTDKTIGRVDLHNLRDGSLVKSFASEKGASASWPLCVTFSPDGCLLAASDWNGTVTLWDVATGQRQQTITDHRAGVCSAVFAPDGATLATGGEDKTLRLSKVPRKQ